MAITKTVRPALDQWLRRSSGHWPPRGSISRFNGTDYLNVGWAYNSNTGQYSIDLAVFRFDTSFLKASDTLISVKISYVPMNGTTASDGGNTVGLDYFTYTGTDNDYRVGYTGSAFSDGGVGVNRINTRTEPRLENLDRINRDGLTDIRMSFGKGPVPSGVNRTVLGADERSAARPYLLVEYAEQQSFSVNGFIPSEDVVPSPGIKPVIELSSHVLADDFVPSPNLQAPILPALIQSDDFVPRPLLANGYIAPSFIPADDEIPAPILVFHINELGLISSDDYVPRVRINNSDELKKLREKSENQKLLIEARTLAGFYGPVFVTAHLFVSDVRGNEVRELKRWNDGSVSMSNTRDDAWNLSFQTEYDETIDPYRDFIKAAVDVWIDSSWKRYPMGLYRFDNPGYDYLENFERWNLSGSSTETLIAQDSPDTEFVVNVGDGALATVKNKIIELGWPVSMFDFPNEDRLFTSRMSFSAFDDTDGSTWLRIFNAILSARGFYALKTDRYGRWNTRLRRDLLEAEPDVIYGEENSSGEAMIVEGISEEWSDNNLANVIKAISQNTDQDEPIHYVAINDDPNDPASTISLGPVGLPRRIVKNVSLQSIDTFDDAERIARSELQKASSLRRNSSPTTLFDPRRTIRESYGLDVSVGSRRVMAGPERWGVNEASFNLTDGVGTMSHAISATSKWGDS